MKKILLTILIFSLLFSQSNAFLGEDLGTDLYKNIDEGFEQLEIKNYSYVISEGGSIKDNLNEKLVNDGIGECIESEITQSDLDDIYNGSVPALVSVFSDNCGPEVVDRGGVKTEIRTGLLNVIFKSVREFVDLSRASANRKSDKIYSLSRIGLYSDGNTENSPFDLIEDLREIDKIIFSEELVYEGEAIDISDDIYEEFNESPENYDGAVEARNGYTGPEENSNNNQDNDSNNGESSSNNNSNNNNQNSEQNETIHSEEVCIDESLSGLNQEEYNSLQYDLYRGNDDSNNSQSQNENNNVSVDNNLELEDYVAPERVEGKYSDYPLPGSSEYSRENDEWGCNEFICIEINFKTYEHNLLGGGQDISIEYLAQRSNNHLKKFVNTSLAPAKMSANNFELGLKDINLSDSLNGFIQISKKPVPMLDVANEDKGKDEGQFSATNLFEEYYKALGLEYSRANDLNLYLQRDQNAKTTADSAELDIISAANKWEQYNDFREQQIEKYNHIEESIDKKILFEETGDFAQQFLELERFTRNIYDYIQNFDYIILKMNEIAQDKS